MAQWHNIILADDLTPGMHTIVELETVSLMLVNVGGEFYAVQNLCSHDGGDLNGGEIDGSEVICPRHGARFCLKTGAALCAPAFEDIDTYPVRVVEGLVQVCDEAGGS